MTALVLVARLAPAQLATTRVEELARAKALIPAHDARVTAILEGLAHG